MDAISSTPVVARIEIRSPFRAWIHTTIVTLVIPSSALAVTTWAMVHTEILTLHLKERVEDTLLYDGLIVTGHSANGCISVTVP